MGTSKRSDDRELLDHNPIMTPAYSRVAMRLNNRVSAFAQMTTSSMSGGTSLRDKSAHWIESVRMATLLARRQP